MELAVRAGLGMVTVCNAEKFPGSATERTIFRCAAALGVTPASLVPTRATTTEPIASASPTATPALPIEPE
ncbi:hypothetical protein [Anaeromyxobacter diazotrophicus]|nr:hypothetical protein [Anaeromyxobacter diazotrophicus]